MNTSGPSDSPPSLRGPAVGDITLLLVDDDPETFRPFLVTHVVNPTLVSGTLFFRTEDDRHLRWVRNHARLAPSREQTTCWVPSALRGSSLGNWRYRTEQT